MRTERFTVFQNRGLKSRILPSSGTGNTLAPSGSPLFVVEACVDCFLSLSERERIKVRDLFAGKA
jgi:hypothetical protein